MLFSKKGFINISSKYFYLPFKIVFCFHFLNALNLVQPILEIELSMICINSFFVEINTNFILVKGHVKYNQF